MVLVVKNLPANAGDVRDTGSILELGRSPGEGNGNLLQYSCLENSMDRGAWWAPVHGNAELDMKSPPPFTHGGAPSPLQDPRRVHTPAFPSSTECPKLPCRESLPLGQVTKSLPAGGRAGDQVPRWQLPCTPEQVASGHGMSQ